MPFVIILAVGVIVAIWHAAIMAAVAATWAIIWASVLWFRAHPWLVLSYLAGYLLAGAVWSVGKWYFAQAEALRSARADFQNHHVKSQTWAEYKAFRRAGAEREYAGDLALWVAFWPISLVWTLLNDPLRRLAHRIVEELRRVYARVSDYVWQ